MGLSMQDKNRIFGRIGLTVGLVFGLAGLLLPVDIMRHKGVLSFPVALAIMLVIGGGAVWVFIKFFFHPELTGRPENEDLLQNGVPAVAAVLKKWDTGWTINTQPKVELLLEVQLSLPDCPAYEAKIKTLIPRLQPDRYNPGMVLEVRVDPKKPERIAIVGAWQEREQTEDKTGRRIKRNRK